MHYYLNYSSEPADVTYSYGAGSDLLTEKKLTPGAKVTLAPWDLILVEEEPSR